MPESFAAGLDGQTRTKSIDTLNATLPDVIAMTLAVKQAHWTLKGPGFIGVHELLDQVAARLRDGADLIAERSVILGGYPDGTLDSVASNARLKAYPTDIEAIDAHVEALTERMKSLGEILRNAIAAAGDAGDEDSADVLTEVSRSVDKDAWFIGANLSPRG